MNESQINGKCSQIEGKSSRIKDKFGHFDKKSKYLFWTNLFIFGQFDLEEWSVIVTGFAKRGVLKSDMQSLKITSWSLKIT